MLDTYINKFVWIRYYHSLEDIEVAFHNIVESHSEYPDIHHKGIASLFSLVRYNIRGYIYHVRDDLNFLRTNP